MDLAHKRSPNTGATDRFLSVLKQTSVAMLGEFVGDVIAITMDFVVKADIDALGAVVMPFETLEGLAVFRF